LARPPEGERVDRRLILKAETVTTHIILAIAALSLATTCMISAGFVLYVMIGEINRKLPDNTQIGYLWFYWSKMRRILREYKRFYPSGRLGTLYKALTTTSGILLLLCAWAMGLFR
jgi:hypothetical protein